LKLTKKLELLRFEKNIIDKKYKEGVSTLTEAENKELKIRKKYLKAISGLIGEGRELTTGEKLLKSRYVEGTASWFKSQGISGGLREQSEEEFNNCLSELGICDTEQVVDYCLSRYKDIKTETHQKFKDLKPEIDKAVYGTPIQKTKTKKTTKYVNALKKEKTSEL